MARYPMEFDGWTQKPNAPVHHRNGEAYDAFVFHKKLGALESYCIVSADRAADVPGEIAKCDAAMAAEGSRV